MTTGLGIARFIRQSRIDARHALGLCLEGVREKNTGVGWHDYRGQFKTYSECGI